MQVNVCHSFLHFCLIFGWFSSPHPQTVSDRAVKVDARRHLVRCQAILNSAAKQDKLTMAMLAKDATTIICGKSEMAGYQKLHPKKRIFPTGWLH